MGTSRYTAGTKPIIGTIYGETKLVGQQIGTLADFNGNPIPAYQASTGYSFARSGNIGATGANLETQALQFVKDEAGDTFVTSFDVKTAGNQGFDLPYVKMENGKPQLVIGEAKAGDSAMSAFGENREKTLATNLNNLKRAINESSLSDSVKRTLNAQIENKTYHIEVYTGPSNAPKAASRFDDVLRNRLGPVQRVVSFPVSGGQ